MSHNDKSETHILGVLMVCFFLLLGLHIHTASDNNHPFTTPSLEYSSTASLCADRHSDEEHLPYLLPSCRKIMISAQYTANKALKLLNRFHPGVAFPTSIITFSTGTSHSTEKRRQKTFFPSEFTMFYLFSPYTGRPGLIEFRQHLA